MSKKEYPIIDWRSKFQRNYDIYGGRLARLFNLSDKDVAVYIFLLTRKWYTKDDRFSKNGITNELNAIPSDFVPNEFKRNYDAKTVEKSLIRLENYGFVQKCKNQVEKKPNHRNPDYVYETITISDLRTKIIERVKQTQIDMLGMFREMENTEEDSFYVKNRNGERPE
ncbi:MAG: hypothetical protein ACRDFB_04365 [Rhabdochlamydiaceae bacterium]